MADKEQDDLKEELDETLEEALPADSEEDSSDEPEEIEKESTSKKALGYKQYNLMFSGVLTLLSLIVVILNFVIADNINFSEKRFSAKTTYLYDELDSLSGEVKALQSNSESIREDMTALHVEMASLSETVKQAVTKIKVAGSGQGAMERKPADLQNINSALQLISKRFDLLENRLADKLAPRKPKRPVTKKDNSKKEGQYYMYKAAEGK